MFTYYRLHLVTHLTRLCLGGFSIGLALLISFVITSGSVFAAQSSTSTVSSVKPLNTGGLVYPAYNFLGCGTGWNDAIDYNLENFKYAYTTGSQACSQAIWDIHAISQSRTCTVNAYIPSTFATANISYGFYNASGSLITRYTVNQANVSGEVQLGGGVYGIHHILISSNNGQTGTYMAAAYLYYDCGPS